MWQKVESPMSMLKYLPVSSALTQQGLESVHFLGLNSVSAQASGGRLSSNPCSTQRTRAVRCTKSVCVGTRRWPTAQVQALLAACRSGSND